MLHSLVLGLGRAGSELHINVLRKARAHAGQLFDPGPVVACDPDPAARRRQRDVIAVDGITAAARLVPPERTVAHVCSPPTQRTAVLAELAEHGFRRVIIEKPLAADPDELVALRRLRTRWEMNIAVVAHWLDARLTEHLAEAIRDRELGQLRSISVAQHKPRFTRSLATTGHPTAFDVEVPHSLGVVLSLAGPAELTQAELADMHCGSRNLRGMGGARLALRHADGVTSEITSDLTSPVQERRITLEFTDGHVTGHYPISEQDEYAQLTIAGQRQVFADDALTRFVERAYRTFDGPGNGWEHGTFELYGTVTRLTAEAKRRAARGGTTTYGERGEYVRESTAGHRHRG